MSRRRSWWRSGSSSRPAALAGARRWPGPSALVYFAYILARAHYDGRYPYPFINVARIGWERTAINAVVITLAFMVFGLGLVALDRLLKGKKRG